MKVLTKAPEIMVFSERERENQSEASLVGGGKGCKNVRSALTAISNECPEAIQVEM